MNNKIDKVRNRRPDRKLQLSDYEEKEKRIYYRQIRDRRKYQNQLLKSLATDTGFDVICSSCLQYKSKSYCKPIRCLSKSKIKKFIVKSCCLLKNRAYGQFVCHLCLKDIKMSKVPKRSHINSFKYANFPRSFVLDLKKKCSFKQSKTCLEHDKENYERERLQLNKLESYLLKLVIPFIRIAHCPRGPYFKVRGDLILISSDIYSSLSKILPLQQSLIPVCFKRKRSYTGSYIEEFVEKEKIEMYYSWFSKHNHLYKDIQLDTNLIDDFIDDSTAASKVFEENTKDDQYDEKEVQVDISEVYQSGDDQFEPLKLTEDDWTHDQTTMFLNKYCEDTNIPTVANRVADIIVDYETHKEIPFENDDDFEIDDEIINEEEFLRHLDEDLDAMLDNKQYQDEINEHQEDLNSGEEQRKDQFDEGECCKIEEPLKDISTTHKSICDEVSDHLDTVYNPTKEQANQMSQKAKKQANGIMKRWKRSVLLQGKMEHLIIGERIFT